MKASEFVLSQPWAMLPEMVNTLMLVADRLNEAPESVAARLGKPLDNTRTVELRDGVAVIPVRGPISRYASMFSEISGATSVDELARDFHAALDSPEVSGIVLEIDSPGGQAAGIGELAAMVRAGSKSKPVTCYVSNLGASAALWLAVAGSRVVCAPQALLGSMGVVWPVSAARKDDKGPRTIEFVSSQSPNKRPDPETASGKAEMQRTVDAMAQVFVESVAEYRGMKPSECIAKFGRGGLLVGRAAVDAGMADATGTLESCISDMKRRSRGGRAVVAPQPFASGAPAAETQERSMKLNMVKLFTGWMSKGRPEVMDSADIADASTAAPDVENEDVATANLGTATVELVTDTKGLEASIERAKAEMKAAHLIEMRNSRKELFGLHAETYLSLHAAKILPAERESLKRGYVGAAMMDAECPAENHSFLGGFKASVEARTPHSKTAEILSGDAKAIADKLSAENLKLLESAGTDPDKAKADADAALLNRMLEATDFGRSILEDGRKSGK